MTDIRKTLESLADAIENLTNIPTPEPVINDRALSGNKINGGMITNFSSAGIKDNTIHNGTPVLTIESNYIKTPAIQTNTIKNPLTVQGNLSVQGEITATKLHVNELSADIRNERTSPLEFKGENGPAIGKGLIWTGGKYTMQFVLQKDRLLSSESIDVSQGKDYRIGNQLVLSESELGSSVTKSNIRKLGPLDELKVNGSFVLDNYLFWDNSSQRLGIGTDAPNGVLSIASFDHEFVIDPTDDRSFKIGSWTTAGIELITDDTTRISIGSNGNITLNNKVSIKGCLGVNVKNFTDDVDITTAGAVRFQDKKFEVSESIPTNGSYKTGDVVWNSKPQPTGYVGWICVREGTPGVWKPFGQISA